MVLLSLAFLASTVVGALPGPAARAARPGHDGRIAFVRDHQIYTMSATGRRVRQLTHVGRNDRPKWSPDGRRISYIHEAGGRRDVWVMSARGWRKQAATHTGDVTSAGATWSPDGRRLAYATTELRRIRSTAPFGLSMALDGVPTGGYCDGDDSPPPAPVRVDRFVAWSPDGSRIAVFDHADCYFDDRIDLYFPATRELRQYAASGADSTGYLDWSDLFWGPGGELGYSERDLGEHGEDADAPSHIVYPGFASRDGDTGGAPSPSGSYLALTNASTGTSKVIRANADGTGRRVLTTGHQPDWQPRP